MVLCKAFRYFHILPIFYIHFYNNAVNLAKLREKQLSLLCWNEFWAKDFLGICLQNWETRYPANTNWPICHMEIELTLFFSGQINSVFKLKMCIGWTDKSKWNCADTSLYSTGVWHSVDDRISASDIIKGTGCKLIIYWLFSEEELMFPQSWKGSVALFILMQQKKLPWVEVYNSLFDSCLNLVLSSGFCTVTCSIWFIIWSHLTNEGKWRVGG